MNRVRGTVALAAILGGIGGCDGSKPVAVSPDNTPAEENGYAALAKLPDWRGVWQMTAISDTPPVLTPPYAAEYAAFQEKNRTTPGANNFVTASADCVPPGLPRSMLQPFPIEFLFTPGRVTVLMETFSLTRRIYTDGTPLPADPDPSYQGTSVGHWEGDMLVVQTIGILPETNVLIGTHGHSDEMRVQERMRLSESDTLEITTTIDDPLVFVEPYTSTARYQRHRDWKLMEYECAQNNHAFIDEQGNVGFRLDYKQGE